MTGARGEYIPAAGFKRLTPLYDPVVRWTTRERVFKSRLVEQAAIGPGHRALDLGCGTGTLAILAKRSQADAEIIGLDADPEVLAIALRKARAAGATVHLTRGMSFLLPYADGSFDRVLSSLFFHHLTRENKERTLREIFRVLRPRGELHVTDWGKPGSVLARAGSLLVRLLDGLETTADNLQGLLPRLFGAAGFQDVRIGREYGTIFGTLALYSARRP